MTVQRKSSGRKGSSGNSTRSAKSRSPKKSRSSSKQRAAKKDTSSEKRSLSQGRIQDDLPSETATSARPVTLKKLHIQNYRSCIDTNFEPRPDLSVLIGPNGSGKTNILYAIRLLHSLLHEEFSRRAIGKAPTRECKLKAWFDVDGKKVILTVQAEIYPDEDNRDVIVSSRQTWYLYQITGSKKRIELPLLLASEYRRARGQHLPLRVLTGRKPGYYLDLFSADKIDEAGAKAIEQIAAFLEGVTYYSASQFTNPSSCPVSIEIDKLRVPGVLRERRGIAARFIYDLYLAFKNSDISGYGEFFDIIGPRGVHLVDELEFQEIPTSSQEYTVRVGGQLQERRQEKILVIPRFTIGKNTLSPNQLSEGTFRTISLLFYLVTRRSTLLLIEEPEVCVHHGLLSSVIELIASYAETRQTVVTTHSDFVLDHVDPSSLFAVSKSEDGYTEISQIAKRMSQRDLKALRNYLESEGSLGEYWKAGALD